MSRYTAMVHAQYESQLIAERTANKIAISKRAGLWMGGNIPLGYNTSNKQLFINNKEAEIIKFIFNLFIETGSVTTVVQEAQEKGYKTKLRKTNAGMRGGKYIDKGVVYHILNNVLYIAKIKHKDKIYQANHEAIISQEQWDQAQQILKDNCINKPLYKKKWKTPPYLRGIMKCGKCSSGMILHSTTKKKTGKQYRYYTPNACEKKQCNNCPVKNLPADEIESVIIQYISIALKTSDMTARVIHKLHNHGNTHYSEKHVVAALSSFEELWRVLSDGDKFKTIRGVIEKVVLYKKYTDITFRTENMGALFDRLTSYIQNEIMGDNVVIDIIGYTDSTITMRVPDAAISKRRNKLEVTIELPNATHTNMQPAINSYNKILVKTIAQAFYWSQQIENGEESGIEAIAEKENIDTAYVIRLLKLTRLAPDIIQKVLEGTQPKELRLKNMIADMPDLWQEQRVKLGM